MNNNGQFDYKKFRSEIAYKFDINLDETALAIVRIVCYQQSVLFDGQNKKLDAAIKDIDASKKSRDVSKDKPKSQAFWFGFGLWGISTFTFIICSFICFFYWESVKADELLVPDKLNWYKQYYQILKDVNPK